VDFNGGDLPGQPVGTYASVQDCADQCCANGACAAFSVNSDGACYLKGPAGYDVTPTPFVVSGCFSGECSSIRPSDAYFPWFNRSIPREERLALLVANATQAEAIAMLNDGVPGLPRLGLPAYSWEAEALHGVSWAGVATVFPGNAAWGAAFDVPLVAEMAAVIALEARAKYVVGRGADGSSGSFSGLSFMTPNNNLSPDPTWGRAQEASLAR
jgi:hypothetical protein